MKARLRRMGAGGAIAALLATGTLLLPAAPAQAEKALYCHHLEEWWRAEIEIGDFWRGMQLWEQWVVEC